MARNDVEREAGLARVTGFDHTMRFSYGIDAIQGRDRAPSVQWWRGREAEFDYVLEVAGRPVPVGLAYRSHEREQTRASVEEFLGTYDSSVGLVVIGDTLREGAPVEQLESNIVELPYWFNLLLC